MIGSARACSLATAGREDRQRPIAQGRSWSWRADIRPGRVARVIFAVHERRDRDRDRDREKRYTRELQDAACNELPVQREERYTRRDHDDACNESSALGRCRGGPWRAPRQPRRGRSTSSSSAGGWGAARSIDGKQAGPGRQAETSELAEIRRVPVRTVISSAESLVRQPSAIGRPTVSASRSAGSSFEYLASGSAPAPSSALLKKARAAAARTTSRISASVSAKSLSRSISA
jgi:hypothetical protein